MQKIPFIENPAIPDSPKPINKSLSGNAMIKIPHNSIKTEKIIALENAASKLFRSNPFILPSLPPAAAHTTEQLVSAKRKKRAWKNARPKRTLFDWAFFCVQFRVSSAMHFGALGCVLYSLRNSLHTVPFTSNSMTSSTETWSMTASRYLFRAASTSETSTSI